MTISSPGMDLSRLLETNIKGKLDIFGGSLSREMATKVILRKLVTVESGFPE
jgi:hypothetical protein